MPQYITMLAIRFTTIFLNKYTFIPLSVCSGNWKPYDFKALDKTDYTETGGHPMKTGGHPMNTFGIEVSYVAFRFAKKL